MEKNKTNKHEAAIAPLSTERVPPVIEDKKQRLVPVEYTVTTPIGTKRKKVLKPVAIGLVLSASAFAGSFMEHAVYVGVKEGLAIGRLERAQSASLQQIHKAKNIMMGAAFSKPTDTIEAQVNVTMQTGEGLCSSECLINGHNDKGEWFQWGLRYYSADVYCVNANVWRRGVLLFEDELPINGKAGDNVLLQMHIDNGKVFMEATNTTSGDEVSTNYATEGSLFEPGFKNGTVTGVFTELWVDQDKFNDQNIAVQDYHLGAANSDQNLALFSNLRDMRRKDVAYAPRYLTTNDVVDSSFGSTDFVKPMPYEQIVRFKDMPELAVSYSDKGIKTGSSNNLK